MKAFEIKVKGIVQGVGFRYFTKVEADKLNLSGTVENLSEGSVKIMAEGTEDQILKFLSWCHEGPKSATVDSLSYCECQLLGLDSFEILR